MNVARLELCRYPGEHRRGRAKAESSYGDIVVPSGRLGREAGRVTCESALSRLRPGDVVWVSRGVTRGGDGGQRVTQGWNASR